MVGLGVTGSVRVAALVVALAAALVAGCGRGIQRAGKVAAEPGRARFESYCAACHQYDGKGVGEAPPFEGSAWVTGPQERLIKIVLHGVRGAMVVDGKTYNREMPGFGQILSNEGSSGTAVRGQFGDKARTQVGKATSRRCLTWTSVPTTIPLCNIPTVGNPVTESSSHRINNLRRKRPITSDRCATLRPERGNVDNP